MFDLQVRPANAPVQSLSVLQCPAAQAVAPLPPHPVQLWFTQTWPADPQSALWLQLPGTQARGLTLESQTRLVGGRPLGEQSLFCAQLPQKLAAVHACAVLQSALVRQSASVQVWFRQSLPVEHWLSSVQVVHSLPTQAAWPRTSCCRGRRR